MNTKFLTSAAVAGLAITAMNTSSAGELSMKLECSARGAGDIGMRTGYEARRGREKFTLEFEAGPRSGMIPGAQLGVLVEGVLVAKITLKGIVTGDIVGELDFDSTAGPFDNDAPFPKNWPGIKPEAEVTLSNHGVTMLGCQLKG